eukprot:3858756-Pyramimonas_sp.AAC.1
MSCTRRHVQDRSTKPCARARGPGRRLAETVKLRWAPRPRILHARRNALRNGCVQGEMFCARRRVQERRCTRIVPKAP